jgi:heat shock protein beta
MTKQDLINNLGTVAKSGTTNFIEAIKGGNLNLIGQFGVGFYSTFLAGSQVDVYSKHNDDDQYLWSSSAANSFTIVKDPEGNTLKRGTKIIIHLKQDAYEFSEEKKIQHLIKKYSEFINFPIYLRVQKEVEKEVEVEEEEKKEEGPPKSEGETDEEKKDENAEEKPEVKDTEEGTKKTKMVTEKVWEWELTNDNKAIWLRNKDEIEDEEYNKFFRTLTKTQEDPLTHIHFKVEGEVEFRSILFIPGKA